MRALISKLQGLKPWQMGGLAALVVAVVVLVFGASSLLGGEDGPVAPEEARTVSGRLQLQSQGLPVNGILTFPKRVALSFNTNGEVGEIRVQEGQQVEEGQLLAQLDQVTVAELAEQVAQARFNLDLAEEALEQAREEFVTTPLQQAQFEFQKARAKVDLEDADEALADFQRDYERSLALALGAKADAEVAVDRATDGLDDFQRDHSQQQSAALQAKADAEFALDRATQELDDFERDESQELARAREARAKADLALDNAQDALLDFIIDYDQELAAARQRVSRAEESLEDAEDALSAYKLNPVREAGDEVFNLDIGRRLATAVDLAEAELNQARKDLSRIDGGPNSLRRQELESEVDVAQANLAQAQVEVAELEQGLDHLELQRRQAAVDVAQARLDQAVVNLEKELDGPDQLRLQQLEANLDVARASLAQATIDLEEELEGPDSDELELRQKAADQKREEFTELSNGPDPLVVELREAQVAAAQAVLDDALEDLAGSSIHAPFDGVISLINVEPGDQVNQDSKVIEIVDPRESEVVGSVDAINIDRVTEGAAARITIAALGDQEFPGEVVGVAEEPRTERGVVSYPVRIALENPQGLEIPVGLSAITVEVLP